METYVETYVETCVESPSLAQMASGGCFLKQFGVDFSWFLKGFEINFDDFKSDVHCFLSLEYCVAQDP